MISRHCIKKNKDDSDEYYSFEDFRIGKEIKFYSRNFKIVGCDLFTRVFIKFIYKEFYQSSLDIVLLSNMNYPADQHTLIRHESDAKGKGQEHFNPGVKENDNLKQFLENDGRVLRFYCVWDDTRFYF